jgi:23S rRNA (cytidine1920-2'-O)/16S rRNA (cytidine1409-2'-O)-methyltransferase
VVLRRRLDAELVRRGLVDTTEHAARAIEAGQVFVGGSPTFTAARLVSAQESLRLDAEAPRFVSRGGEKLAAALDRFALSVAGARALDAGASTGGFTDCLLRAGAAHVVAVDVARGQLAWSLRTDARVTVLERTNVRQLEPDRIGGRVDVAAVDLSFVSLVTVAPALARCCSERADVVALVKPQFEAGRARVGSGGVVRDPEVHRAVLRETRDGLAARGLIAIDAMPSPLRGADGNVEFLFHLRPAGAVPADALVDDAQLDACVDEAVASPGARR